MGAWGDGIFENDDAMDFIGDLAEAPANAPSELSERFEAVEGEEYVESPDGTEALAAAAIVSAARDGSPVKPDEVVGRVPREDRPARPRRTSRRPRWPRSTACWARSRRSVELVGEGGRGPSWDKFRLVPAPLAVVRAHLGGNPVIARYTRPEIGAVWTDEARFGAMRDVEVAAAEALDGPTPEELDAIRAATFTVDAINEREKILDHDTAPSSTSWRPPRARRGAGSTTG